VGSYSVNGVAALHSKLLREGLFSDFAELWPEKFNNKTNGVTQRRWLAACNRELAELISEKIGSEWTTDLAQLEKLAEFADDPEFQLRWRTIKQSNKSRLAKNIAAKTGLQVSTDTIFDVQVKRIHEYKRQLLNLLHAVHLYDRIRRGDGDDIVPRTIIIGGKAAPGYVMAKNVIKCINNVARVINSDPLMDDRLRLLFYPDYNVSAMEIICPAATAGFLTSPFSPFSLCRLFNFGIKNLIVNPAFGNVINFFVGEMHDIFLNPASVDQTFRCFACNVETSADQLELLLLSN